jgi:PIN domain nuclease of toxin-antitoxin system
MRLLIDTQSFIWFFEASESLPAHVRAMMEDRENRLVVSMASFWEITIKVSLQKLKLSTSIEILINKALTNGFELLPIEPAHLITLSTLYFHHKDPFDRMIIAQAISENLGVISSDGTFRLYPVKWIW